MPPIPYRKEDLADPDTPWDAGKEVAATDDLEDLRRMCAWEAPDATTKEDFKLPHHHAGTFQTNLHAVQNALARLPQTDMPDDDRPAVEDHLRRHLEEFRVAEGTALGKEGTALGEEARAVHLEEQGPAFAEPAPRIFAATLIRAGRSKNGYTYTKEALQDAVPLFEGAPAFLDHAGPEDLQRGTRSVRDVAGAYGNVYWDEDDQAVKGELSIIHDHAAALLTAYIRTRNAGRPVPPLGLSADLTVQLADTRGHGPRTVARILRVHSVDIVFGPAAGGAIHKALEQEGETTMEETPTYQTNPEPAKEATMPEPICLEDVQQAICQDLLRARLTLATDLPQAARDEIKRNFEGRIFTPDELDNALNRIRRLVAELSNPVQGHGPSVQVLKNPLDRIQEAADFLFGVPGAKPPDRRLTGIRELYITLTGDAALTGRFCPDAIQLSEAEVTTTTFANVVKNALNKVLLAAYNGRPKWWQPIVWEEDFQTLNTITWVKVGGISTLPTVAEGDPYTELDWADTGETSAFVKKGGYIGITLEAIDRDDVAALRRAPRELGNAAWRTLSSLVAAIFTANSGTGPQMADGYYLFDATHHGNLRTAAFSIGEWANVVAAMFKQTAPGSSHRLGIRPRYCLVPIELEKDALIAFNSVYLPGTGDNDVNPYYNAGTVIPVPEWTDANDWAAVADPNDCPGICIGYRYGREPELFVADQPEIGSMFTNDEIRMKVRFYLAVGVADYRPLHKNNVA